MAGSRKWFVYTTDAGTDFAIEADESNVESYAAATQDYPETGSPPIYAIPRNVKPRFAIFGEDATKTRLKIPIITQTLYNSLTNTDTMPDPLDSGNTLRLVSKTPEKIKIPKGRDTGKVDGDAT